MNYFSLKQQKSLAFSPHITVHVAYEWAVLGLQLSVVRTFPEQKQLPAPPQPRSLSLTATDRLSPSLLLHSSPPPAAIAVAVSRRRRRRISPAPPP